MATPTSHPNRRMSCLPELFVASRILAILRANILHVLQPPLQPLLPTRKFCSIHIQQRWDLRLLPRRLPLRNRRIAQFATSDFGDRCVHARAAVATEEYWGVHDGLKLNIDRVDQTRLENW
jgi:hypothetical protein